MKISFFVLNLASNPIVRAWPLAQAARDLGYEVEVLGFIKHGEEVYAPYRGKTDYKIIYIERYRDIFSKARDLAGLASGDFIYCCKPTLDTLLPSIHASGWGRRKPLFLDAEDNELWTPQTPKIRESGLLCIRWCWITRWKLFAHLLLRFCRYQATVSTSGLQKRYGGQIVLHGPDENVFNPKLPQLEANAAKKTFRLSEGKFSILFAGMPQRHKGVDLIIDAVEALEEYELILAGDPQWPSFKLAKERLNERCRCVGMIPNDKMPLMLAAVDLVVVPQRLNDFTRFQMPAKLLEAMAMAKGVVVSNVSDLPDIVAADSSAPRGWVCEHDDVKSLVRVLREIAENADQIKIRGERARIFFFEQASRQAISKRLMIFIKNSEKGS